MFGIETIKNQVEKLINVTIDIKGDIALLGMRITKENTSRLIADAEHAKRLNSILANALCGKYERGTVILYDEKNPRDVFVIKDGKQIDMNAAKSLCFNWSRDEFPSIEITQ